MLRTTIQTTDKEGKELPIPPDLLAKVQRADEILQTALRGVGKKFDINVRWEFDHKRGDDFDVLLGLRTPTSEVPIHPLPKGAFDSLDSLRRTLSTTLWTFGELLSAELEDEIERIRRDLQTLATVGEN